MQYCKCISETSSITYATFKKLKKKLSEYSHVIYCYKDLVVTKSKNIISLEFG